MNDKEKQPKLTTELQNSYAKPMAEVPQGVDIARTLGASQNPEDNTVVREFLAEMNKRKENVPSDSDAAAKDISKSNIVKYFRDRGVSEDEILKFLKRNPVSGGADDVERQSLNPDEIEALDEWRKQAIDYRDNQRPENELIGVLQKNIRETDDVKKARIYLEQLKRYARVLYRNAEESRLLKDYQLTDEQKARLREIMDANPSTIGGMRAIADMFDSDELGIKKYFNAIREFSERDEEQPRSLEDLVKLIMTSEEDKWRLGGEKQLMNEKDEINMGNLLAWMRAKIWFYHDFSPDDEIRLFSSISIPTRYRAISFGEMIYTDKYFVEKVQKITRPTAELSEDADAQQRRQHQREEYEFRTNKQYQRLKEQMLYEAWLYETSHNNDAAYRSAMGTQDDLVKTMKAIYMKSVFTKDRNRLLRLLKMPTSDQLMSQVIEKEYQTAQGTVGKGLRKGLLAYYHLPEIIKGVRTEGSGDNYRVIIDETHAGDNMFYKVLDANMSNGVYKFYEAFARKLLEDKFKETTVEMQERFEKNPDNRGKSFTLWDKGEHEKEFLDRVQSDNRIDPLYNYRSVPKTKEAMQDYALRLLYKFKGVTATQLNIFDDPRKDPKLLEIFRGSVQVTLKDMGGRDFLDDDDAKYAENLAYSMVFWTGINARNDTNLSAHDRWATLQHTKEYRVKQSQDRAGVSGELETMGGIKRAGVNWWEGLRVRPEGQESKGEEGYNRTLISFLQGADDDIDLTNPLSDMEFAGSAERKFYDDHLECAFGVYDFLMNSHGMNLDQITTVNAMGRLVIDQQKADEIVRRTYKDIRYAFDNAQLLYNSKVRDWEKTPALDAQGRLIKDGAIIRRNLVFATKTLRETMFHDSVIHMGMYERHGEGHHAPATRMARNVLAWMIAAELHRHRKTNSVADYWGTEEIEKYKLFWESIPIDVMEDKNGELQMTGAFFDEEEWEKIEEEADAVWWKVFMKELWMSLFGAAAISITQSAREFSNEALGSAGGGGGGGGHH